ncbi:GumC family protein [Crenobacter cavernae]|uniref:Lipopolysaccharide biosynthesis protein n=1 Tax=Crenobacter cavernae TaxID=2290923 RepID=A0A345Y547_9NEIS|nr:Wzz/FepE/Etk N-terminal domain-containing protein [Crenobacter cavernae]AXK39049.1 hypothetical protein DWG20_06130 [Crenobacter cavernae]
MSENQNLPAAASAREDEIDLMDMLIVLVRQKKWVIGCTVVIGGAALVASLLMTQIFTSKATIMPPQQQSSGLSAMLGKLAGDVGGMAGLKNPNDLYVGMLESRTVADSLIRRFKLKEMFETQTMDDTRSVLNGMSNISSGKDGLISVSIDHKDPLFAAQLANAYVEELVRLTQTLAVTDASQRRLFFEKQLKQSKEQLALAEVALRKTQEKTGLLQPEGQIQSIIGNVAQLRATIAAKEVQLTAMRSFATEQNPEYQRTQQEIGGLKAQLAKLEQGQQTDGDFMVPTGKVPQTGLEYIRRLRDVKYHETMFELLAKQFEMAKIEEAKDTSTIQVLDRATPADRKSKPKRAVITLLGVVMGFFVGVLSAFAREGLGRSRQGDGAKRWAALRQAWRAD